MSVLGSDLPQYPFAALMISDAFSDRAYLEWNVSGGVYKPIQPNNLQHAHRMTCEDSISAQLSSKE